MSYTETDPVFGSHVSSGITASDITNWSTAYGWGDHSAAGYLMSYSETDPIFSGHVASGITPAHLANWNMAFNWGDHAAAGYGVLAKPNKWLDDQTISHPGSPRFILQDLGASRCYIEFHDPAKNNGYIIQIIPFIYDMRIKIRIHI